MAAKPKRGFVCTRCGKRLKTDTYIFSRFTGARYCIALDACAKRSKKRM